MLAVPRTTNPAHTRRSKRALFAIALDDPVPTVDANSEEDPIGAKSSVPFAPSLRAAKTAANRDHTQMADLDRKLAISQINMKALADARNVDTLENRKPLAVKRSGAKSSSGLQHEFTMHNKENVNPTPVTTSVLGSAKKSLVKNILSRTNKKMTIYTDDAKDTKSLSSSTTSLKSGFSASSQSPLLKNKPKTAAVLASKSSAASRQVTRLGYSSAANLVRDMTHEPYQKCAVIEPTDSPRSPHSALASPTMSEKIEQAKLFDSILTSRTHATPSRKPQSQAQIDHRCKELTESPLMEITQAFVQLKFKRDAKRVSDID